jgi:hypothetical protein
MLQLARTIGGIAFEALRLVVLFLRASSTILSIGSARVNAEDCIYA